ncbi:MAG: HEAT repeat domain-containing protein [Asgard group archaeon]|nr:HEAT repeat domain-containing protein [Asgard group archaeon]
MSEESKKLLLRLKNEKKITKQIDLVKDLKDYNKETMVTQVMLVHLNRKENDELRLEILNMLNYEDESVIDPLINILKNPNEPLLIKEKAIALLGKSKNKKAMKALLKAYRKEKDSKILDNVIEALTYFEDSSIEKPLIKALLNEELRLQALSGLSRNIYSALSSYAILKTLFSLKLTKSFEKLHYEKILTSIFDEFGYKTENEIGKAISDKSINEKIASYIKNQKSIDKMLKKVDM